MTLPEFFDRLLKSADALMITWEPEPEDPMPTHPKEMLIDAIERLRKLSRFEETGQPYQRSGIQVDWKLIRLLLEKEGVFKEFEGDSALREKLAKFIAVRPSDEV